MMVSYLKKNKRRKLFVLIIVGFIVFLLIKYFLFLRTPMAPGDNNDLASQNVGEVVTPNRLFIENIAKTDSNMGSTLDVVLVNENDIVIDLTLDSKNLYKEELLLLRDGNTYYLEMIESQETPSDLLTHAMVHIKSNAPNMSQVNVKVINQETREVLISGYYEF